MGSPLGLLPTPGGGRASPPACSGSSGTLHRQVNGHGPPTAVEKENLSSRKFWCLFFSLILLTPSSSKQAISACCTHGRRNPVTSCQSCGRLLGHGDLIIWLPRAAHLLLPGSHLTLNSCAKHRFVGDGAAPTGDLGWAATTHRWLVAAGSVSRASAGRRAWRVR